MAYNTEVRNPADGPVTEAEIEKERWAKSLAKKLLYKCILSGRIKPQMTGVQVRNMHDEYKKWPQANFTTNLRNLREKIAKDYQRMLADVEWYGHDVAIIEELREGEPDRPIPWHRSDGPAIVKYILDNDRYPEKTPEELYNDPFYHEDLETFSLAKFRKHLHQERYKREKVITKARYKKKGLRATAPDLMPPEEYLRQEEEKENIKAEKKRKAEERKKKQSTKKKPAPGTSLETMTVPQLKDLLRARGLKVTGKKAQLIELLKSNTNKQHAAVPSGN